MYDDDDDDDDDVMLPRNKHTSPKILKIE